MQFLETYQIHASYHDFFSPERVLWVEETLQSLKNFTPQRDSVFASLRTDLKKAKIMILGQDPYPQEGVATGLAFQVKATSWLQKEVNTSLKNILKLLYFSYTHERKTIEEIRREIENKRFEISSPYELLESWQNQGVILLNTALTTEIGHAGSHLALWKGFMCELIEYMTETNRELEIFIWGNRVASYKKYVKFGKICESNHPAICGNLEQPQDYLNNFCFIESKRKINWLK